MRPLIERETAPACSGHGLDEFDRPTTSPKCQKGSLRSRAMNHSLISLGAINIEARDPVALARFWAAASGAELPTDEGEVV